MNKPFAFHLDNNSAPLIRNAFGEVGTIVGAGVQPILYLIAEGLVAGILSVLVLVNPMAVHYGRSGAYYGVLAYSGTRSIFTILGRIRL